MGRRPTTIRRLMVLFVFSVCTGVLLGGCSAAIIGPAGLAVVALFAGSIAGGAIGAIISPVIMVCLRRKVLADALMIVFGASYVSMIITSPMEDLHIVIGSTTTTMVMVAVCCRVFLPDDKSLVIPDSCENCGYNLKGNVSGVCPECGKPINGMELN